MFLPANLLLPGGPQAMLNTGSHLSGNVGLEGSLTFSLQCEPQRQNVKRKTKVFLTFKLCRSGPVVFDAETIAARWARG